MKETSAPIIKTKPIIWAFLSLWFVVFLYFSYVPYESQEAFLLRYAFRTDSFPHLWWQIITHSFIHIDIEHFIFNVVWFLVFGTLVAGRTSPYRFVLFYMVCVVCAILLHLAFYRNELGFVIGASGGIAGLMGGAVWFIFPLGHKRNGLMTFREILASRQARWFILVWCVGNVLFGLCAPFLLGMKHVSIAWLAHIGGFFGGLVFFPWFASLVYTKSGGMSHKDYGEWLPK